jgi:hypothetical protein
MWWDKTIVRWEGEGLPAGLSTVEIKRFLGLDVDHQLWIPTGVTPQDDRWIVTGADYDRIASGLYPKERPYDPAHWEAVGNSDEPAWITFDGFFWWPRVLFGIEAHFYAFYDEPELMHRINQDLCEFMLRTIDALPFDPDFMTFAEDMSYNHGPMLSRELFEEFLAPYYRQVVPELKKRGTTVLVDSDGDVSTMVPWLLDVGIEGALPLERRAGVDIARLQANHPAFRMIGGFDKTVMSQGEAAMREEFERLLPVMRQGGFIPSVDHQTPPNVDIATYRLYLSLLAEYAAMACSS